MKMSRSKLKELIKECIVEVLAEGIGTSNLSESSAVRTKPKRPQARKTLRSRALDSIKFDQRVNETASAMTSDPVMQSIFSDTAKTTLQDQLQHSQNSPSIPVGADAATRAAALSSPEELFEGSSNWATLAFSDAPVK